MGPISEVVRYSRQMLVCGSTAQVKLRTATVLVVGGGALGCGCLPYLVGAGVGHVTICDGDIVEISNLHRQVMFAECDIGKNKAKAAAACLRAMNSGVTVIAMARHCTYDAWTLGLIENHVIVVDCSDNVGTRYLLNDLCFLSGKALVSAAALGREGSVARWGMGNGPCYRCVSPQPSLQEARRLCTDQGVLGPVPGLLGALQALEVLHHITANETARKKIRFFDGFSLRLFELSPQRPTCELCGEAPTLDCLHDSKQWALIQGLCVDLTDQQCSFGSFPTEPTWLPQVNEKTALDLWKIMKSPAPFILVDVRDPAQTSICRIDSSISLPLRSILQDPDLSACSLRELPTIHEASIFVICRRGLDSRIATTELLKLGFSNVYNIAGGLDSWRCVVDPLFPAY